ncbi:MULTISPECIES: ChbG/HpnK family deacetylase [unclassified Lebetimonas]|uniref:ChbG/HpnK family deacetylase n=1 Tax=unclassified Lebetimonas TaxID=2648158 RepID=UPI00046642B1|nr:MULTISPECIES: ChbG/HpnK family deacetylase [unclassified Lebetimonas]
MKQIFIHADDYGNTKHISEVICKCIDEGVLNSVSIIVNSDALDYSLQLIKNKNIRKVLHLNITEGKQLSKQNFHYLTDNKGCFFRSWQRLFFEYYFLWNEDKRKAIKEEIKEEFKNQIILYCQKLNTKDINIDSHQHFHTIPFITDILIELKNEMDIKILNIRVPKSDFVISISSFDDLVKYLGIPVFVFLLLNKLSNKMIKKFQKENIKHNDKFVNTLFCGDMKLKTIKKEINNAKNSNNIEILLHPGYISEEEAKEFEENQFKKWYLHKNRKKEKNLLLSKELQIFVNSFRYNL